MKIYPLNLKKYVQGDCKFLHRAFLRFARNIVSIEVLTVNYT